MHCDQLHDNRAVEWILRFSPGDLLGTVGWPQSERFQETAPDTWGSRAGSRLRRKDVAGARDLAERDKHEFQKWITATIGAQPYKGGKKGMDRGIDGYLHFRDADKKPQFAIVSVKGGENINSAMVRDLKGTMEREKAALGLIPDVE